jgi:hypothetical protein
MEIYTIRILDESGACELTGDLGIVDKCRFDSQREAALHAQFCAQGNPALLRILEMDGTLKSEREIPPAPKSRKLRGDSLGGV